MDHPRACGENFLLFLLLGRCIRITPARAGKTVAHDFTPAFLEDHPRACGENLEKYQKLNDTEGSPPRVRGKRRYRYDRWRAAGITPARAGKTYIALFWNCLLYTSPSPRDCS